MAIDVHVDDLYELVCEQTFQGQKCLNVYFYRTGAIYVNTLPTNAQVLVDGFVEQILPDIISAQSDQIVYNVVRARNLYDPVDSYTRALSEPGYVASSDFESTFDALAFTLQGETRAVRTGAKRQAGVPDSFVTDGVVTGELALAAAASAAEAMGKAIQVGTLLPSDVFFPTLVKRVRTGTPGHYTYELPSVRGEGVWTTVINVLFDVLISSQVSRKIGRGV